MNALVVTSSEKSQEAIARIISLCADYEIEFAKSPSAALKKIRENRYDVIVINNEQSFGRAKETALTVAANRDGGVIFIENEQAFEATVTEFAAKGIIVVPKPLSRASLIAAVQSVNIANMRLIGLKEENRDLNKQLQDLKIIDRAKIALIQRLGYTESEAHKYIEKQAMNLRVSKREIAVSILKTYEF